LAEQGNARAQLNLGVMYAKGEGISVNDVEAIRWIGLAAKQGNIGAQYSLGFMYHQGEGVLQNNVRAYVWYSVVAAQGEAEALISRDIVSEELTPDQLAQAQQIAAKCFESDYQDCE
jgi:TPR repeat protein